MFVVDFMLLLAVLPMLYDAESLKHFAVSGVSRSFLYDDYVDPVVGVLTSPNARAFVSTLPSLERLSMAVMVCVLYPEMSRPDESFYV